jgi:hypothetical protein
MTGPRHVSENTGDRFSPRVVPGVHSSLQQVSGRAPDPVMEQQHDHHEDRVQNDAGALETGRSQFVLERDHDRRAEWAAPEGADPTKDADEHGFAPVGPVQLFQRGEPVADGKHPTDQPDQPDRQDEHDEFVAIDVVTECARGPDCHGWRPGRARKGSARSARRPECQAGSS